MRARRWVARGSSGLQTLLLALGTLATSTAARVHYWTPDGRGTGGTLEHVDVIGARVAAAVVLGVLTLAALGWVAVTWLRDRHPGWLVALTWALTLVALLGAGWVSTVTQRSY